jgi:glycosyltransferase involved in cell wall biosynthesis
MSTADSSRGRGAANPQSVAALELSVVMPCLNEAETLAACIEQAQSALAENGIAGEVIVADNGSTDGSIAIAEKLGARVVNVSQKGYGNALMGGIAASKGKYILMGDADCSYDFRHAPRFLEKLRQGGMLVMGNRFRGGIADDAMPPLHRYFGNPVLTRLARLFFRTPCGDVYCGLRGFSREAYTRMNLRSTGMEFATEMVVKATLLKMPVTEVPTTLSPDGRSRPPHLRTWRDGWRTLRFFFLYSPRWLFLYPGLFMILLGLVVGGMLLPGPLRVAGVTFDAHTLMYCSAAIMLGVQAVTFAVFSKVFAISEGLLPDDPRLDVLFRYITLETGIAVGTVLVVAGLAASVFGVTQWEHRGFGPLDYSHMLRVVIPAVTALMIGAHTIFSSFFLSILGLKRNDPQVRLS